ncbi:MAG: acyltransferase family protein [Bacteroidales bacterium]|nr:acyltransferase family protein [Bacteroidales bacterium]
MSKIAPKAKTSILFSGLDILKFVLAIMVMDIHLGASTALPEVVQKGVIEPLHYMRVPVFFLISSFFLFKKVHEGPNPLTGLKRFLKRILTLYTFWVVVWMPYIIVKKPYFSSGWEGPLLYLRDFFLGEVFGNSWFLGALITGSIIIFLLSRVVSDRIWWILPVGIFAYGRLIPMLPDEWAVGNVWWLEFTGKSMYLSFPYNLMWITLGYYLAKPSMRDRMEKYTTRWRWLVFPAIILCINPMSVTSLVTIPVATVSCFAAFYTWRPGISRESSTWLRRACTLFYVQHGTLEKVFRVHLHWEHGPVLFAAVFAICLTWTSLILYLAKKPRFTWLRWAY